LPGIIESTRVSACNEVEIRDGEYEAAKLVSGKREERISVQTISFDDKKSVPHPEIRELQHKKSKVAYENVQNQI
jgi:hypothetical protein